MTLRQIDSLCDEFEASLRNEESVRIEDILPKIEETKRSDLLKELLEIEVQFACEKSLSDSVMHNLRQSFRKRFPDQQEHIQSLFQNVAKLAPAKLQQIGNYEIISELGRGGMGIVYKAKHKLLKQTVAIKVLSQNLLDDSQAIGRFKREMQLIGGLTHPNIVRALNAGEIDGEHYLAMEFVEGITLHKLVESSRRESDTLPVISLGAASEAIRQASLGLQNAHELKLVHRDIKPANLMIDHRGTVKILDLGLGKFADEHRTDHHSSLTMAGMIIGTVDYISPEQCEDSAQTDIRSDVYGLGCTLFFLLTGRPVYSGHKYDTMRKKLMAHVVGEVPSVRATIPSLPPAFEAVLQKALAKDPAERYQTPFEFAEALAPFASFDELWALTREMMPSDSAGMPSSFRHTGFSHTSVQSSQHAAPKPVSRLKMILLFVGLHLLFFGLATGIVVYYYVNRFDEAARTEFDEAAARLEAAQAEQNAWELLGQWRVAEAESEFTRANRIRAQDVHITQDALVEYCLARGVIGVGLAHWYLGDAAIARRRLQTFLDGLDVGSLVEESKSEFSAAVFEHLGDFVLFGGAASMSNPERFAAGLSRYDDAARARANDSRQKTEEDGNELSRYDDAVRLRANDPRYKKIRWKQAMLLALNSDLAGTPEDLQRASTLLEENPLPDGTDDWSVILHRQLAVAVLHYYQSENHADRNRPLRSFLEQFTIQHNVPPGIARKPEIATLLMFCAEFLLNDSLRYGYWNMLDRDVTSLSSWTGTFLRDSPGAIPFMRRFHELLIRSAVAVYTHSELPETRREQIMNIVRMLDRMRPLGSIATATERATLVYFFLPESNRVEEGFVLFFPQTLGDGAIYPLQLTRQMVRQRRTVPPLDAGLLARIATEKATGRRIRISWSDTTTWFRMDDALTESDYPFGDVLPLVR